MRGGGNSSKSVVSKERSAEFKPIEDLKEGDVLQPKEKLSTSFPKKNDKVFVYRVLEKKEPEIERGTPVRRFDFTILAEDEDGEIIEYPFESRNFERVIE